MIIDNRIVHVFNPALGRAAIDRLADAVAAAYIDRLFNSDDRICQLSGGRLTVVNRATLGALIQEQFASVRLTTSSDGIIQRNYPPLTISGQDLADVEAAVLRRIAPAPSVPKPLSDRVRQEIIYRARTGEAKQELARVYGTNLETINDVVRNTP